MRERNRSGIIERRREEGSTIDRERKKVLDIERDRVIIRQSSDVIDRVKKRGIECYR